MTVEAIAAVAADAMAPSATPLQMAASQPQGFGDWFVREIGEVNRQLVQVDHEAGLLAAGKVENLHEVMIHMQEAKLSFQLLAQVRNRMLEAYQEVMRTQV